MNYSTERTRKGITWWPLFSLPLVLFIALPPLAILINITLADLVTGLRQEQIIQAINLSLVTASTATLLTILFGTPIAYLLARRRTRWLRLLDTLIDIPTVLPPAVAGVALLLAFGRRGLLGSWLSLAGISIPFTPVAVVMAQMFIASPLYIKAAAIGFGGIPRELLQSAALDGANRWQSFRYVTLPLANQSILSGSTLTWARALGEFGATIIFAGNFPGRTQTMPLAIYLGFELEFTNALVLSFVLIVVSFFTLLLVKWLIPSLSKE